MKNKGITLIALVITIIILLILTGITINLTIGEHGILNMAKEAGKNYQNAAEYEQGALGNFFNEAQNIIAGGNGNSNPGANPTVTVSDLEPGDYIKYNTGKSTVGDNGVITCRVLYPATSEYGLQIISKEVVGNKIQIGEGSDWNVGVQAYNGALMKLNEEAEKYINTDYVFDARCVGSLPTAQNGILVNKNKGTETTVLMSTDRWEKYVRPTTWSSDETGCFDLDTNYEIDWNAMGAADLRVSNDSYWLASRWVGGNGSWFVFSPRVGTRVGDLSGDLAGVCRLRPSGPTTYTADGSTPITGLRPVFLLKSDTVKITGGDGKGEATAYTLGI